ncbi:hypothetical protein BGZ81_011329 [Podila clonocystis]|nr:hypothetical protein BGZ81_011329 [Podila clonocystis]
MRIQWTDLKAFTSIGSGSFGRVFHGDLLGTEVAIKECVRSESRAFDEKYFKREVDILKQSRHPNIVQFMGICKRKKRFYIITEFLPLGNLRQWIQDETKEFGWDTRISFAIDISLALAYLHHKNIIHRDLKGENLLVSENMRIKVCDFGFSRVEAKDDDEMRRISYCGTDGYMAPEILLGEDFDCSVDVFSFGVILSEMMAKHVVDSQHFQRIPPDMCISPDEILFRAQTGCPLELGELAIHCVQFQPYNRPKLQYIVERLTAIENVDIHVGTTLLVAPSVARAARNMMRKQDAETKRNQPPPNPFLDPESQFQHPSSIYRSGGTVRAHRSSIIDETETWRMTDPENRDSDLNSQDTFKGGRRAWKGDSKDSGTSNVPLVMDAHHARRRYGSSQGNNTSYDASVIRRQGDGEEEPTFRMPLWDAINSPGHQGWSGSESVRISTINGDQDEASLQSWDQERYPPAPSMQYVRHETDSVRLSSIRLDIRDDDEEEDEFFKQGSGFLSGSSDEDDSDDSLFDEDSENDDLMPGMLGLPLGRAGPGQGYQLSSDSEGSSFADTDSVTESVVLALDTLEIPDHAKHTKKSPLPAEYARPPNPEPSLPVMSPSQSPPDSPRIGNSLFRQPSLISRLLPPIPASVNPWGTPRQSPPPGVAQVLVHTSDHEDDSDGSSKLIAKLASATAHKLDGQLEDEPLASKAPEMLELPPAPPSKSSSLLMRTNTWKAKQTQQLSQEQSNGLVTPTLDDSPSGVDSISTSTSSLAELGSSSSSTSLLSNPDDLPSSTLNLATSSSDKDISEEPEPESRTTTATNTLRSISPSPRKPSGPRDRPNSPSPPGLIRGMSDSFWNKSHSSAEAVNTLTSTMVMNARTWTGSTAFGTWIGGSSSSSTVGVEDTTSSMSANNTLKMPTICILEEEDSTENGTHDESVDLLAKVEEKEQEKEASEEAKLHLVKRRSIKRTLTKAVSSPHLMALTGISHRFSLVAFSALLLPKCDVCQKRIGVLPGWSSKHLECDDCGYRSHPKCVANVVKCCSSARKSGVWDISV